MQCSARGVLRLRYAAVHLISKQIYGSFLVRPKNFIKLIVKLKKILRVKYVIYCIYFHNYGTINYLLHINNNEILKPTNQLY